MFFLFRLTVFGDSMMVFFSLPPMMFTFFMYILLSFFVLLVGSFFFVFISMMFMVLLLLFGCFFMWMDIFMDFLSGLLDFLYMMSLMQMCFLWFMCSELFLFLTLFACLFGLCLFSLLEFAFVCSPGLVFVLCDYGFVFYFFWNDFYNLIINTLFLFVSGLFCNFFIFLFFLRFFVWSFFCLIFVCWWGFCFMWNQMWEFSLILITLSCGCFGTVLFSLDILHFTHVLCGFSGLLMILTRLFGFFLGDTRCVFLMCCLLYWHFVDLVWFFLLSFVYFDILLFFLIV